MSVHIPEPASLIILLILSIVLVIDLVATVNTILRINKKLEHIEDLSLLIRKSTDELGENLAIGVIALSAKKDELEELAEYKKKEIAEKITQAKKTVELNNIARKQKLEEALQHREKTPAELKKANREILEAVIFGQRRLLKAFPNIKSTLHNEALEKLKDYIFKSTDI
jgi:c-di-AMP phosphodiesterase-like protein